MKMVFSIVSWLLFLILAQSRASKDENISDISVLLEFKRKLSNTSQAALSDWNASNSDNWCHWTGILCNSLQQHITSMDLAGLNLNGTIPPALSQLKNLQALNLASNPNLKGDLESWAGHLDQIKILNLSGCSFFSNVPQFLSRMLQLEDLDLSACSLHGEIPPFVGYLQQMRHVNFSHNHLQGTIGPFLNCSQLQVMDLSSNVLSGEVLPRMHLRNLSYLSLRENNLSGGSNFLAVLSRCQSLQHLDLSSTKLQNASLAQLEPLRHLSFLDASHTGLAGGLPDDLNGWFPELRVIYLSGNNLSGGVPASWTSNTKVTEVDFSLNSFSGPVPTNWSTSLKWLDLSHNQFRGTIPHICLEGSATELEYIDLSGNRLSGQIPSAFGKCSKLQSLQLCYNNLHGHLPSSLNNCSALRELKTDWNDLQGAVFEEFPALTTFTTLEISGNSFSGDISHISTNLSSANLIIVNVAHNSFTGAIPDTVCSWEYLMVLSLAFNSLTGSIPECMANLADVQILDLSNNYLSGVMPRKLHNMSGFLDNAQNEFSDALLHASYGEIQDIIGTNKHAFDVVKDGVQVSYKHLLEGLKVFDVSNNLLKGDIPQDLGQLKGIRLLNLSHNDFSGSIPWELGNVEKLLSLDLSHNNLHGPIPWSIAQLQLSSFSVAYNNLSGPIPTANVFNTKFGMSSFEGNPGLVGCPLTWSCSTGSIPSQIDMESDDEEQALFPAPSFYSAFLVAFFASLCMLVFRWY